MFENILYDFQVTGLGESALRIFLAGLFGFFIGIDREAKKKPIDFRAYMLVAVTACLMAIIGLELQTRLEGTGDFFVMDLGKIIAGTLTGIGFLGAGAIIRRGDEVVGTATGASIWAAGGMGVALGFGYYGLSILAAGAILIILIGFGFIRGRWIGGKGFEKNADDSFKAD